MRKKTLVPISLVVSALLALMMVSPVLGQDPDPDEAEFLFGLVSDTEVEGVSTDSLSALSGNNSRTAHADTDPDLHSQNMHLKASLPKPGTVNSDLAFWGDLAFAGNYGGFRIIDISAPGNPKVLADVSCPGPQNDVSVWGNLLFLSVDQVRTKPTCDSVVASPQTDPNGWEGIRIFDVSNPSAPQYVGAVATDCGSHTHTLIPDLKRNRVLLSISSYPLRSGPRCGPENAAAAGYDPLHRKISIVEVPLNDPASARVIATPPINVPVFDIGIPGFNPMIGCHDISVFLELHLAAAACGSAGQVWDISDPANPKAMAPKWTVDNPNVQFYHSATFTWDGKITIFGDEVVRGTSCQSPSDMHGRLWFYDTGSGIERGSFLIPRAQPGQYCSAHLFNVLALKNRYVLVSSWYAGGTNVVDFTNPAAATEIGYYDAQVPVAAFTWSSYWYNNFIYANDILRGVDVFLLSDDARAGARRFDYLNPQTQEEIID